MAVLVCSLPEDFKTDIIDIIDIGWVCFEKKIFKTKFLIFCNIHKVPVHIKKLMTRKF